MKPQETWIYAVLLLIAVGISWSSWTTEEVETKTSAEVFDPGGSLTAIRWDGEKNVAELVIEGKGDDRSVWVKAGRKERIVQPKGDDDDSAADDDDSAADDDDSAKATKPKPEPSYGEAKIKEFPGNDQATKLVDSFSPLKALRQFGKLDADTLAGMGLDEPGAVLVVEGASRSVELAVGSKAYGSSDTYVMDRASNTVYLISSKVVGPLRGAESRLIERNLHPFEATEVATATVRAASGQEVAASHEGRHDKDNAFWADPADLSTVDTGLDAFLDTVFQVRASTYLAEDERVGEADVEPLFQVAFQGDAGALGKLELARVVDAERSKGDEPVYDYYARADRTRGQWVKVSRSSGTELADAMAGLFGS